MKHISAGMLAHVDAGKTTMAEAMLYLAGAIERPGRVDHRDTFLDTQRIERRRGITVFSKQALLTVADISLTLLDTPGHTDFSAETERTLSVLDYAILVISGPDGVQAHTATLWELLKSYGIPTFIWVNKTDLPGTDRKACLELLHGKLSARCIDMLDPSAAESIALTDETALEEYLAEGSLSDDRVADLISRRRLFPCWFGSALKLDGVDEFLRGFARYARQKDYPRDCRGRIFKISRDEAGTRLSWIKLTGGTLRVRDAVESPAGDGASDSAPASEKISQLRLYNGERYEAVQEICAGQIAAAAGPELTFAGQAFGGEARARAPMIEPVLSYRISPDDGTDVHTAFARLSALSEEDPMLRVVWNEGLKEIEIRLMGDIQTEVLRQIIADRFGMSVRVSAGRIMYRETIEEPVEGVGHFEPLRHYAEVHLLMEPLAEGSGIILESLCAAGEADAVWQKAVLSALAEKKHAGVLTGSPLTDVKISLAAVRTHPRHTEGGDLRQAACRAVRQGLMEAKNILLEPWYSFRLEVPAECVGRAIGDLKAMHAEFEGPADAADAMLLTGTAPVGKMQNYQKELLAFTSGRGRLSLRFAGYFPCCETAKVVEGCAYDPERDTENPADSVFCSKGAGVTVKWDRVREFMHVDSGLRFEDGSVTESEPQFRGRGADIDEKEFLAIMEREFGPAKKPVYSSVTRGERLKKQAEAMETKKDYLIVDGYNVIFAWEELKKLAAESLPAARERLADMLSNYRGYRGGELVLVFDGDRARALGKSGHLHAGVHVVYTPENQSADGYIEKLVHDIGKNYRVRVATSDSLIQLTALRSGVIRLSSRELEFEVRRAMEEIGRTLASQDRRGFKLGDMAKLENRP